MVTAVEEKVVNVLAGTSLASGTGVSLVDFNVYLETGTLVVGLTAGLFALFFQIRRWYRGRQKQLTKE